jgi:predicted transcriptional regulator
MNLVGFADLLISGRLARLRSRAQVVYLAVVVRSERGLSTAKKALAADTGLDRGTVARALADLESCGILQRTRRSSR